MDPFLLAAHVEPKPGDRVLDVGTGSGVIALILAKKSPQAKITGVEVQPDLAEAARANILKNDLEGRVTILQKDVRTLDNTAAGGPFDLILANPPFEKCGAGRINPERGKAIARHELCLSMKELIETARRLLTAQGSLYLIYPVRRLTDLIKDLFAVDICPVMLRFIHIRPESPARWFVLHGIRHSRRQLCVAHPMVVYTKDGRLTPEVKRQLCGSNIYGLNP